MNYSSVSLSRLCPRGIRIDSWVQWNYYNAALLVALASVAQGGQVREYRSLRHVIARHVIHKRAVTLGKNGTGFSLTN